MSTSSPTGATPPARIRGCGSCASSWRPRRPPLARFTPVGADPDSVIDVRAVFHQGHRELAIGDLPAVLLPRKVPFGLIDYEEVFCADP